MAATCCGVRHRSDAPITFNAVTYPKTSSYCWVTYTEHTNLHLVAAIQLIARHALALRADKITAFNHQAIRASMKAEMPH